ncbi:sensor histidine kinase [Arenibaculum pallidiluteum]|uniref:sensor histidine kinase n=1 Tax=Arenibaculum pallidiluteum TaxID=2812559 RepID=UPI001A9603DC|nr:HAMP domain-containing sensor histidine kinase [Arenibaculum pallidiluteum]
MTVTPAGVDETSAAWMRHERIAAIARFTPALALAHVVNSGLVVAALWGHVPAAAALAWLLGLWALVAQQVRRWLRRRGGNAPPPAGPGSLGKARRYAGLYGAWWGGGSILFLGDATDSATFFMLTVLAGIGAGAAAALAPVPSAAVVFIMVSGLPTVARLAFTGEITQLALAGMVLTYIIVLLLVVRTLHEGFREDARLKVENRRLVAELRIAQSEAERAAAAKDRFIAMASHDLRQPLQAMALILPLLRGRLDDPTASGLLDSAETSLGNAIGLFDALLDTATLKQGEIRPDLQRISVEELFERLRADLEPIARERRLELRFVRCRRVVFTDPKLLERMLRNVVLNALRYTEAGRVVVGCRGAGAALRIDVCDTGPGIVETDRDRAFEPFERLGRSDRTDEVGHGLGLAVVKATAELLSYPIALRSRPGHGTCFSVQVPLAAGAERA